MVSEDGGDSWESRNAEAGRVVGAGTVVAGDVGRGVIAGTEVVGAGLVGRGAVVGYTQHRSGDAVSPCDVPCRLSDRPRPHLP